MNNSRSNVLAYCLFLALASSFTSRGEEGRPIIAGFTARDTGGSNESWVTIQDERGVLYFGCFDVLSFDGEHWKHFPIPGSYAVTGLALGPAGRIWVGALNEIGYFDKTDEGLSAYHSLVRYLPDNARELGNVWQVIVHNEGAVFVTATSVLVWDGRTFQIYSMPGARRLFAMQTDENIYICNILTGVWSLDRGGLHKFISSEKMNNSGVVWMEKDSKGLLLVTTNGLIRFVDGKISEIAPEASAYVRKNMPISACRLPHGDLCIGTLNGGLAIVSPSGALKRIIGTDDGLQSRSVYSLFIAQDGALWTTSAVGITRIAIDSGVSFYNPQQGLTGKPCNSIAQSGSRILVATEEGVFGLSTNGTGNGRFQALHELAIRYSDFESGPGDSVYAAGFKRVDQIFQDRVDNLFLPKADVLLVHRSLTDPDSFLLANDFDIVRFSSNSGGTVDATTLAHLPDMPKSMVEDKGGNIWVGTYSRGAFFVPRHSKESIPPTRLNTPDGLPIIGSADVTSINESTLVFTPKGVERYRTLSRPPVSINAAPSTAAIAVSNHDPSGAIWVVFESPFSDEPRIPVVGRLSVDSAGHAAWNSFDFPGLTRAGAIKSIFVDNRGIVWLGGTDGLLRLVPDELKPMGEPRPPAIRASVGLGERLPSNRSSVSFDFAAVEYLNRLSFRFQTLLSGSDDWSPPTNESHIDFARLRDGRYDFAVRVVNDAGLVSPVSNWQFTILPPWYRTLPGPDRVRPVFSRRHLWRLSMAAGVPAPPECPPGVPCTKKDRPAGEGQRGKVRVPRQHEP